MYLKLPPIDHLRSILETFTMFSTLPWGVEFEKLEMNGCYAECITPKDVAKGKVIIYLHGGGYVIGSPHSHRGLAGKIAKCTGLKCLVVDYRKAPEHPFPAALDDAYATFRYVTDGCGVRPEDVVLVGDSAGGGLVLALQLRLKEEGFALPRCSVLLSPYVDLENAEASRSKNAKNDRFLDVFEMRKWAELYAGGHDFRNPLISPVYGNLEGLGPVLIQVSLSEVLFEDSRSLYKKLARSGVEVELQSWKGLIHWWHMFPTMPESKEAIHKICFFIRQQFSLGQPLQT